MAEDRGKDMDSIWDGVEMPAFGGLERDCRTDVLIIGGGMTGLLCAHLLGQAGVDCLLVEAGRLCGGVTGRTTAKVTVQHGMVYHRLMKRWGEAAGRLYLEANRQALEQYRSLCRDWDCDWEEQESWCYTTREGRTARQEAQALAQLGVEVRLTQSLPLPVPVTGAVGVPGQAQIHPLKLAARLAEGKRILEHTRIEALHPGRAVAAGGTIFAERVVVATHFPFLNTRGGYFLKLYQHRSYVVALEGAEMPDGMYVEEGEDGLSFRRYGPWLLLGGGGHRTGHPGDGWQVLEDFTRQHWPQARVVSRWATQDCMTLDGVPYIGRYSPRTPDLYVATGYNKWGMTSSMVAATLLTHLIVGQDSPYTRLFAPDRPLSLSPLLANSGAAAVGLLTPTIPRCPHMGCALRRNGVEGSWDCPCHGSRFAADGTLLNGPATDGLKGCP